MNPRDVEDTLRPPACLRIQLPALLGRHRFELRSGSVALGRDHQHRLLLVPATVPVRTSDEVLQRLPGLLRELRHHLVPDLRIVDAVEGVQEPPALVTVTDTIAIHDQRRCVRGRLHVHGGLPRGRHRIGCRRLLLRCRHARHGCELLVDPRQQHHRVRSAPWHGMGHGVAGCSGRTVLAVARARLRCGLRLRPLLPLELHRPPSYLSPSASRASTTFCITRRAAWSATRQARRPGASGSIGGGCRRLPRPVAW